MSRIDGEALLAPLTRVAIAFAALCAFALDPFGMDRWVFAKELILVAAALVGVFVAPVGRTPRWLVGWLAGSFLILLVGAFFADAPWAQLWGRWPRYEGFVSLGAYALALAVGARLLGGTASAKETVRRGDYFHVVLAAGLFATAALAAGEVAGLRLFSSDLDRPGSLLGNASDMGVVGVIGLSLFLVRSLSRSDRRILAWNTVGGGSAIALITLSQSRGALVGAGVALAGAAIVLILSRESRRRHWVALAITTASMTALGAVAMVARLRDSGDVAAGSAMNRLPLWESALGVVATNPWTGAGASGFADAVTAFHDDAWFATTGVGRWIESPHSLPLQVLAAGGAPAGIVLVVLAVLAVRHILRHGLRGPFGASGLVAAAAATAALMFHFTSPGTVLLLSVILGASFATTEGSARTRRSEITKGVALAMWAIVLIAAMSADHALRDGFAALERSDVVAAQSAFNTVAALRPWDQDVPLMIAERAAHEIERAGTAEIMPTAQQWGDHAVAALPSSARALKASAVVAQYSGDIESGIQMLEHAAQLSPADPEVFHRLGGLKYLIGRHADAVNDLERAAELAPHNVDIATTLDYVRTSAVQ
ncbi:O-antigen ligase family protein [uncultured Microbacterium sp.]|uniref:O-antigen ligase family protein n=1 Tax=uncultured Microbacterium sp. TaxID=191216 RepID=UPI00262E7A20|nr:O-antigen ligase family protein [uncultured Microbacterium sp.]